MGDEANRDDAKKALDVSRKKLGSGDVDAAIRFCKKSISLYSTSTATSLLKELEALQREGHSSAANGSAASSSSTNGNADASTSKGSSSPRPSSSRSSSQPEPAKKRDYTPEQAAVVKRIRSCKVTDYYGMMDLNKGCTDVEIKKSYRKLALALHPDKNGAPGADEAFKLVSKAFQVLNDPQKRSIFDSSGSDPDDRSASMPSFSRGASQFRGGGGPMFEGEVSAEDLFNMFFGGGAGPAFAGSRGGMFGNGVRFQTFGGGAPQFRRPGQPGQAQTQQSAWVQLLPLIILIGFSLLSSLPSLFTTQPPPDPSYGFEKTAYHDLQRQTHTHAKVDYWVNSRQYATHPLYQSLLSSNPDKLSFTAPTEDHKSSEYINAVVQQAKTYQELPEKLSIPRNYLRFEQNIEQVYLQRLQHSCRMQIDDKNQRLAQARGFFGLGADWDLVKKIEAEDLQACSRLRTLGYRVQL